MSYNGRVPVWGFVSSVRKSSHQDRKKGDQAKQAEKDKEAKRQKEAEQVARLLSERWAEQDRSRDGADRGSKRRFTEGPRAESDDETRGRDDDDDRRGPRRSEQDEDATERHRQDGAADSSRRRSRGRSEDSDRRRRRKAEERKDKPDSSRGGQAGGNPVEEDGDRPYEPEQGGGWTIGHSTGTANQPMRLTTTRTEVPTIANMPKMPKMKAAPPSHGSKVAKALTGIFGDDDSSDAEQKLQAEAAAAAAARQKRAKLRRPTTPEPSLSAVRAKPPTSANDMATVQMKVAQWKQSLKGKAATMPEWLQAEVAAVMGRPMP